MNTDRELLEECLLHVEYLKDKSPELMSINRDNMIEDFIKRLNIVLKTPGVLMTRYKEVKEENRSLKFIIESKYGK
jgi:hypothetical protein